MSDTTYLLSAIAVMVAVNFLTRVFPFLFFPDGKTPGWIRYIEIYFPPVILTILVFYSLKETDFANVPYGAYEIGGVALTVILHLIFKNYLVSIFGGTIGYMAMVQGWFL
jgi:branched-subunit amino acid transport protein AzlD